MECGEALGHSVQLHDQDLSLTFHEMFSCRHADALVRRLNVLAKDMRPRIVVVSVALHCVKEDLGAEVMLKPLLEFSTKTTSQHIQIVWLTAEPKYKWGKMVGAQELPVDENSSVMDARSQQYQRRLKEFNAHATNLVRDASSSGVLLLDLDSFSSGRRLALTDSTHYNAHYMSAKAQLLLAALCAPHQDQEW